MSVKIERYDKGYGMLMIVFSGENISGTETVYSDPCPTGGDGNFRIWYKATSLSSIPRLRLFYEMSYDNDVNSFVKPNNVDDIVNNWSGEVAVVDSISPPPLPWIRFGVQGLAGNPSDTLITEVVINV